MTALLSKSSTTLDEWKDTERKAFEAWIASRRDDLKLDRLHDHYSDPTTRAYWLGWLGRAARIVQV